MGYCGHGMQRWIYTQKTRKLFSKRTKPDSGGNASSSDSFNQILRSKAGVNGKSRPVAIQQRSWPEYNRRGIYKGGTI